MERIERIRREYSQAQDNMPEGCSVLLRRGNIQEWIIIIYGPDQSPHRGGCFKVSKDYIGCTFPDDYPSSHPTCVMYQDNIMHININNDSKMHLGLLDIQ